MTREEMQMHLRAGEVYGKDVTCGPDDHPKVRYGSEPSAFAAALKISRKTGQALEGYPCCWCDRWHVGRAMTAAERRRFRDEPSPGPVGSNRLDEKELR